MPNTTVVAGLNEQIAEEFHAAYTYLSMGAYFEAKSLPGFAHWMRMQYQEETDHALKLFDFLLDRGARVELKAIPRPPSDFQGPLAVMEQALEHEQQVTKAIHDLYELTLKEKDYPAQLQLQWFISEQIEEEKTVGDIVSQLRLAGDSGAALLLLDRQLAARAAAA